MSEFHLGINVNRALTEHVCINQPTGHNNQTHPLKQFIFAV